MRFLNYSLKVKGLSMGEKLQKGHSNSKASPVFSLADLVKAAEAQGRGEGAPPVEKWNPDNCGEMDLVIQRDGTWVHEGSPIGREKLVKLFATILRKDLDGTTYLVTPVEKIEITVEDAAFLAIRVDISGQGEAQDLIFTTNVGDMVKLGKSRPLRVETDADTGEPSPYILVRGRLEALINRAVFYELVELAVTRETDAGPQLGVWSDGQFFALGAAGAHLNE